MRSAVRIRVRIRHNPSRRMRARVGARGARPTAAGDRRIRARVRRTQMRGLRYADSHTRTPMRGLIRGLGCADSDVRTRIFGLGCSGPDARPPPRDSEPGGGLLMPQRWPPRRRVVGRAGGCRSTDKKCAQQHGPSCALYCFLAAAGSEAPPQGDAGTLIDNGTVLLQGPQQYYKLSLSY